jgi:O-succinylbenzoic acid--CoA ligase
MLNLRLLPKDWQWGCEESGCDLVITNEEHVGQLAGTSLRTYVVSSQWPVDQEKAVAASRQRASTRSAGDAENTLVFTSGSSGKPKGVALTGANLYFNALGANLNVELTPEHCWLLSLPLYHVGGLAILHRAFLSGAAVYISNRFIAEEVVGLVQHGQVTHLSLVPTMLERLLRIWQNQPPPPTLRAILLGGDRAPDEMLDQVRYLGLPVLTTYGLTEAGSQVCTMSPDDSPDKLYTSGRPLHHRRLIVVDKSQRAVARGEVGQIAVAGEVLFAGYVSDRVLISRRSDWFLTGDLGYLDEEGCLVVKGRIDELILSGGEKIYPSEISLVADAAPGVSVSAVIGVKDETWGQRPVLFVEMEPGWSFDENALRQRLEQALARYKLPDRILPVRKMPRTTIGKVDRDSLRRLYQQSQMG